MIFFGNWRSSVLRRAFLLRALGGIALLALRRSFAQASAPPLDATLRKVKAEADNWPSEKQHDRMAAVLAEWSTGSIDPIAQALSRDFKGTALDAGNSRIVRPGPALEVRRVTYSNGQLLERSAFLESLKSWLGVYTKVITAEFQIVGIEGLNTRVRCELVGHGAAFHKEQRTGYWNLEWTPDSQVRRLRAETETRSRSAAPWYVDVAAQAFGRAPSWYRQMNHGVDYWRTVLDGASGIDIYGHNGVSAGDIDGDGFDDLYVCQPAGLPNRLYRNRGDGTFEDITESSGLGLLDNTACALIADFNNDGRQDLLAVTATGPLLFLNDGGGKFRQVPNAFPFANPPRGTFTGAAAADYDRDGWLDVYFCLYTYYQGSGQYNYPVPYYAAENGPPNFLMRNNRDGTFTDVTTVSGLDRNNTRFSFCCGWGDFDGNGWPDLYVVNDFGRKNLYRNNGDGTFTDAAAQAGVEDTGAGMGVCWFDPGNSGAADLYVADMWTAAGERISAQPEFQRGAPPEVRALYHKHAMGNSLFNNLGNGKFRDETTFDGGGMGRWAWSCDSWDFDHDGHADLYVANGMISGPVREDLNSFFWRQVVANSPNEARPSAEYEQGWSAINEAIRSDYTWSGYERNVFYANNGDGTFSDVSGAVDLDFLEDGRAFGMADFDHDGRLEILLKSRNAPQLRLLKNVQGQLPPSIAIRLRGAKSNRDAIGAAVTIAGQTKWVQAGSGFLSQHSKELFFGLGAITGTVPATVRWPSGTVQVLRGLPPNHRILIEEGAAEYRSEAFQQSKPAQPSPQARDVLPAAVETWLLSPVPAPGIAKPGKPKLLAIGDADEVNNLLSRHLFDRRSNVNLPTSFLIDGNGEIVKVYRGKVDAQRLASDLANIPKSPEERLERALPFRGNARTYNFGRNHLSLASIYFERGFYQESLTFFQLALRDDPNSAEAEYGVGSVYLKQNKIPEARASFRQATKLTASYADTGPNAWNNLGLLDTREGRVDAAVTCFQQALRLSPDYWIALENLGNAFRQLKRWPEARAALERAVALRPQDPEANYSLGMVLAQTDENARAEQQLRKALDLRPAYPEALNNLGILYLRTRRRDEAVAAFEQCIRDNPAFDQAYLNLARVYAAEGGKAKARTVLQELLKRQPDNAPARALLEQIQPL
jgi:tetratricopeptide (TPR) repeat protein